MIGFTELLKAIKFATLDPSEEKKVWKDLTVNKHEPLSPEKQANIIISYNKEISQLLGIHQMFSLSDLLSPNQDVII